jgi:hypothetical protein
MSKQTLSFEAYYADYKIAATNAGLPVLDRPLIYFAFEGGLTPDDAAQSESSVYLEAQHTAFTDSEGYSLKEHPHRLDEVLAKLESGPHKRNPPRGSDDDVDELFYIDDHDDDEDDERDSFYVQDGDDDDDFDDGLDEDY